MCSSKFINKYYKDFDLILVPHAREELRSRGETNLLAGNHRDFKKVKFIGPIVQEKPTRKINLGKNKFNILATCGGGGQDKNNTGIDNFLAMIKSVSKILAKKIENLNLIVVTGPLYKGKFNINIKGVAVKKYQSNFLSIIEAADLVISSAGYNICNEIIAAKTPSILVPLKRFQESQLGRAKKLEKKGIALVLRDFRPRILAGKVLDLYKNPVKLREMRNNFDKIKLRRGNRMAAKMILNLL
jgi:UDP-N-acetylglucosamine:LPS N-acetylglucosamine transferase